MQPRERTKLTAFSVSQWVFWWYRSVRIWSSPRDKKGTDRKCPQYWKAHIYAQTSRYLVPNDFNKSSIKSKGQLPDLSSSILPQWEAFWTAACTACWQVLHIYNTPGLSTQHYKAVITLQWVTSRSPVTVSIEKQAAHARGRQQMPQHQRCHLTWPNPPASAADDSCGTAMMLLTPDKCLPAGSPSGSGQGRAGFVK